MTESGSSAKQEPTKVPSVAEEKGEPPVLGPALLGLHPVGAAPPPKSPRKIPTQVINARGMPSRIRKKNKLFFNDDTVNDMEAEESDVSSKKPSKSSAPLRARPKIQKKCKIVLSEPKKVKTEENKAGETSTSKMITRAAKKAAEAK